MLFRFLVASTESPIAFPPSVLLLPFRTRADATAFAGALADRFAGSGERPTTLAIAIAPASAPTERADMRAPLEQRARPRE